MKIWFDTEFIEDGRTIDLLSIGMVREDGTQYYAESADCDLSRASGWVSMNVIPHLHGGSWAKPRHRIARDVVEYAGLSPEFWAYYADYDWVVLCQLFGRMIDLPRSWPMFCLDVQQLRHLSDDPRDLPPHPGPQHDAMADALWCREAWRMLSGEPNP